MALGTQPVGKLLDYEQYIDHQIRRTRARIKMTDVLTAVPDPGDGRARRAVPRGGARPRGRPAALVPRGSSLWSGLLGGAAFAVLRIVLPLISRVNGFYAAKTIEEADPTFKNSLINYLDLRRHRDERLQVVLAAVEAKAVKDLTKVEIDTVVNQRRLLQMAYALSGVVVVFCLYAAMTPKSILDSTRRALLADVVRPTNTRLVNIKPGDDPELSRVVSGANVPFSVEIQGTRPEPGHAPLQRRRRQVLLDRRVRPRAELLRPLADHPPQRPPEHRLLPDRRRRRVAQVPPRGPPRADGHVGRRSTTSSPRTRASRRGRTSRGARSRRSRGRWSPSTPGPTSPPRRPTSTSATGRTTRRRRWR